MMFKAPLLVSDGVVTLVLKVGLLWNWAASEMNALPRIADGDRPGGYMMEALMAAIASGSDEAQSRLKDFLEKRGKKVLRG